MNKERPELACVPFWTTDRVASGIIAALYLLIASLSNQAMFMRFVFFLPIPIVCVWYPEVLGGITGAILPDRPAITRVPPAKIVYLLGWALLLFPFLTGGIDCGVR